MTSADCLMLDAKQAILDEHRRRFQVMHDEGRLDEAMRQVQIILSCASDLLKDALRLLDQALETHGRTPAQSPARPHG
jgi:hypothetical protein